jgi:hypothetical protein
MSKLLSIFIGSMMVLTLLSSPPASASEFTRVSGIIKPPKGAELKDAFVSVNNGAFRAVAKPDGSYEIVLPKNQEVEFYFVLHHAPIAPIDETTVWTFSNWRAILKFSTETRLDFQMPDTYNLRITFADANNDPLPLVGLEEQNLNQKHSGSVQGGVSWTGIQRIAKETFDTGGTTRTSTIAASMFPTDKHFGFAYRGLVQKGVGLATPQQYSGVFKIAGDVSLKFCIPVRFGAELSLPKDCFPDRATQEFQEANKVPEPKVTSAVWNGASLRVVVSEIPTNKNFSMGLKVGEKVHRFNTRNKSVVEVRLASNGVSELQVLLDETVLETFSVGTRFASCGEMWKIFSTGVMKSSTAKNKGARIRQSPTVFSLAYNQNASLDRDRDGLVCER